MHIVSPAAAQLMTPPQLSRIALPADLEAVLERRGSAPSADLFLLEGHVLDVRGSFWIKGNRAIATYLAGAQPGARFVPTGYSGTGNAAAVTGIIERGEGKAARPVRNFHLSLVRDEGRWRIAAESWSERAPPTAQATSAATLIRELDEAGVRMGVVHALGYFQASPMLPRPYPDEAARISAENDWVLEQVSHFPGRLIAFCGVNPLREHAIAELRRCRRLPGVAGMKLHFANSNVNLRNPDHVQRLRMFFRAANEARMPLAAHLWSGPDYGAEHVRVFLREIMPVAPDVSVQIMHLSGGGGAYGPDASLAEFAAAVERRDPASRNLYFDVAAVVSGNEPPAILNLIAARIRSIGVERILFGTDRDGIQAPPPAPAWAAFMRLPLRPEEFRAIAANVAPYITRRPPESSSRAD
jgi:predicted TIM-barrel fold metal-dependent hydrolase